MSLRQAAHRFTVSTRGQGLIEITSDIADWLAAQGLAPEYSETAGQASGARMSVSAIRTGFCGALETGCGCGGGV